MMRLTRKVFTDLTIWMIGLGLLMGLVFPFFVALMGIPARSVLTPWFFAACMAAGLIVGAANVRLARVVVGQRLRVLAERMRHVTDNLEAMAAGSDMSRCTPDDCLLASGSGFSTDERNRLDLFRQGLALALHNALLYDRLERLAAIDALTGLYNRRFGLARLREEFGRAVRITAPLGVLMLDLDHFKQVNDIYGHLAGDRVLVRVAKLARTVMRDGDVIVRYGGEELLAILPGASRNDLAKAGERLRRMIEDATIADGEQTIRITASIGGAAYPEVDVEDESALVKLADRALYAAKATGRNRVSMA
jgi:diguanylate cyclase (GGDEF)-like protein